MKYVMLLKKKVTVLVYSLPRSLTMLLSLLHFNLMASSGLTKIIALKKKKRRGKASLPSVLVPQHTRTDGCYNQKECPAEPFHPEAEAVTVHKISGKFSCQILISLSLCKWRFFQSLSNLARFSHFYSSDTEQRYGTGISTCQILSPCYSQWASEPLHEFFVHMDRTRPLPLVSETAEAFFLKFSWRIQTKADTTCGPFQPVVKMQSSNGKFCARQA